MSLPPASFCGRSCSFAPVFLLKYANEWENEQSVKYPTDIYLLDEAREISEKLIDDLYGLSNFSKKPRTYRQKARRQ